MIRKKELKKNKQRLAVIRSAELDNVSIPSNSVVTIQCITSKELDYHPTCAVLVPTEKSVLPDDFDITPAVVHYTCGKNGIIQVQISNATTSTFTVSPRAVICELHPVRVDLDYGIVESDDSEESILNQVSIEMLGLSENEIQKVKDLLSQYKDIFFNRKYRYWTLYIC